MVQILEQGPSFGEQFARTLGEGLGRVGSAYFDRQGKQRLQEQQDAAIKKFTGMDVRGLPESFKEQIFKNYSKSKFDASKNQDDRSLSGALDWLEENAEYAGSTSIPFTKSFLGGKAKEDSMLGSMADPFLKLPLNREAVAKRAEIDATGFWATDQAYTHFNKGQITDKKLAFIRKELAPHAGLSEREYKSRIAALRRITQLPKNAPANVVNDVIDKEAKAVKKIEGHEKGGKLTDNIIDSLLDETNNDFKAAEKLARERGYKW